MRSGILLSIVVACAGMLQADPIGVAVNGVCDAGTCPPAALAFGGTAKLTIDFTVTLPDGDNYQVDGYFEGSNYGNGGGFATGHLFQVTYEGNANGGPSAADSVVVEAYDTFKSSVPSVSFYRDIVGAFGPTIAIGSSASSCANVTLGCVGPIKPPKSFNIGTPYFPVDSTNGAFVWDPAFTNDFAAGSAVGSYIVWGQTTPLPVPTPEPGILGLFGSGLLVLGLKGVRSRRRRSSVPSGGDRQLPGLSQIHLPGRKHGNVTH